MNKQAPRWLILAHPFNMDGRAASHTITDKIPHLLEQGIQITVISGVNGERDTRFEHHQVWSAGPSGFKFELRHVLRQKLKSKLAYRLIMLAVSLMLLPLIVVERLFKPVESSWSWQFSAQRLGRRLHHQKPFDLIYSTAGPFAAHLAAHNLKKNLKTPWLAEVHDPLVLPGSIPQTRRQKAYANVERIICTHADIAIWFAEQAMASALSRQPALAHRGRVILPGVDDPFKGNKPKPHKRNTKMIMGHFGSLSLTRSLYPFIQALGLIKKECKTAYGDIEIHIYGGRLDKKSIRQVEHLGISSQIKNFGRIEIDKETGMSGRQQIINHMRNCEILLLVHGDDDMCSEYMPSKMYEYFWVRRPIIATVADNPQMTNLLLHYGHTPIQASHKNKDQNKETIENLKNRILEFWEIWKNKSIKDTDENFYPSTGESVKKLILEAKNLYN